MPVLFRHHVPANLLLLIYAETLGAIAAVCCALLLAGVAGFPLPEHSGWALAALPLSALAGLAAAGLYQRDLRDGPRELLLRAALGLLLAALLLAAAGTLLPTLAVQRALFVVVLPVVLLVVLSVRLGSRPPRIVRRVLVLGSPEEARSLRALRRASDRQGSCFVGFVDPAEFLATGAPSALLDLVRRYAADEVVVAIPDRRAALPLHALLECKLGGVRVAQESEFIERHLGRVALESLTPGALVFDAGFRPGAWRRASQRVFDLLVTLPALLVALPLMALAALAIWLEDGWPVLYTQQRVGLRGRAFALYKFRSMRRDAEADGRAQWAKAADSRVTRVGRLLRRTRIDELPQLFNVLKGDMSLVGPRPERPTFVALLQQEIPWYALRHHVRPGLTGWAQVRYPYGASVADARAKLEYDLYYLKHASLFLDLDILLHTAQVVLWGRGVR